jgi:UDP-glucose 4-epimerase
MRVLITGGAGYVGSACLRHLLEHGCEAAAFDNLSQGHRAAVPARRLIEGDIRDHKEVERALRDAGAEAVIHCAAATTVDQSVTDPAFHYDNNVAGTLSLLEAMRASGVRRLLFSSTCATYGLSPELPLSEDSPQAPVSPYARTKLAIEWMIRDFAQAYGLGFTLLRYFNAAGAAAGGEHGEDHDPETHLIPLVLQVPLGKRAKILVFGGDYPTPDGTCIRDYVHVDDLAEAHRLALAATGPETAAVYNVGTGRGSSVLEVIAACERAVGRPIAREVVARRPGDPPALVARADRLRAALGWRPRFADIESVVKSAWEWHRRHPDGYRSAAASGGGRSL